MKSTKKDVRSAWMAQPVKRPTVEFGSGRDVMVVLRCKPAEAPC